MLTSLIKAIVILSAIVMYLQTLNVLWTSC